MAIQSEFDAYYKWLGIPPNQQPPTHYRLLGLELFESDLDVIQTAAARQMAHVQSYKIGPQSDLSQKLLNELAKAKVCLLNPTSKAEYDRELKQSLIQSNPAPTPSSSPITPPISGGMAAKDQLLQAPVTFDQIEPFRVQNSTIRRVVIVPKRRRSQHESLWPIAIVFILGLIGAAVLLSPIGGKPDSSTVSTNEPPQNLVDTSPTPAPPPPDVKQGALTDGSPTEPMEEPLVESEQNPGGTLPNSGDDKRATTESDGAKLQPNPHPLPSDSPPVSAMATSEPSQDLPKITLPSGKTINEETLLLTAASIKGSFGYLTNQPRESTQPAASKSRGATLTFILTDSEKNSPVGVFSFKANGKFDGPALILGFNGQPSVMLSYSTDRRNGMLRTWDSDGGLVLFSEFRNGSKSGITCLCEQNRPVLIEDWETGGRPAIYLVEFQAGAVELIESKNANAEQKLRIKDTEKTLSSVEKLLHRHETQWKKTFGGWWNSAGKEITELQNALDRNQNANAKRELTSQLEKAVGTFQSQTRKGRESVLSKF